MSAPGSVRPPRTLGEARPQRPALRSSSRRGPGVVRTTALPWDDVGALGELCDRREAALARGDDTTAAAAARELAAVVRFRNQPGHRPGPGPALGGSAPVPGLDDAGARDIAAGDIATHEIDDEEVEP